MGAFRKEELRVQTPKWVLYFKNTCRKIWQNSMQPPNPNPPTPKLFLATSLPFTETRRCRHNSHGHCTLHSRLDRLSQMIKRLTGVEYNCSLPHLKGAHLFYCRAPICSTARRPSVLLYGVHLSYCTAFIYPTARRPSVRYTARFALWG